MKELSKKFSLNLIKFIPFTLLLSILGLKILPKAMLSEFYLALILIFLGVFLIDLGSKSAISRIASDTSKVVLKKRKIVFYIFMAFILGAVVAVAEPNTWIMSRYVSGFISEWIFILSVAIGIGITLVIAMLRILFKASIKSVFIILYLATLTIAAITSIRNPVMTLLAFDSGGVIPGLVLIPSLIGFGVGISNLRSDKEASSNAFGIVGIVSLGPILTLLIIGLFYEVENIGLMPYSMIKYFLYYLVLMAILLLPILIIHIVSNYKRLKTEKAYFIKKTIAYLYTYFGIVLILTGISGGLIDTARYVGEHFNKNYLILFMIGLGVSVILIEPSIRILFNHILEETAGSINKRFLYGSFIISMILALVVISLRITFSISLWWIIIPGYLIAIMLSLFSKDIFLQISFDAAGSISGFLTIGFILPFLMGSSNINDALGNIMIIQLMPLIVIMSLALIMKKEIYSTPKKGRDDIINI
ncbi:MAG: DUF1538 family protein [Acholeplasmataceae bacterium]|nr:DUF1538 family protein [Acholeplasmataceae bacterium]